MGIDISGDLSDLPAMPELVSLSLGELFEITGEVEDLAKFENLTDLSIINCEQIVVETGKIPLF
jgi:hypothetical protein